MRISHLMPRFKPPRYITTRCLVSDYCEFKPLSGVWRMALNITAGLRRVHCLSSYSQEQNDPAVHDYCMSEQQVSNPRKRQSAHCRPSQLKKQKRTHHYSGPQPPPAFWDNLSKIWLTGRALKELDKRNTELPSSPYLRLRQPFTRALATCQPATDVLDQCTTSILKDIKLFARHGGPDLSDLRGVRTASLCLCFANNLSSSTPNQ